MWVSYALVKRSWFAPNRPARFIETVARSRLHKASFKSRARCLCNASTDVPPRRIVFLGTPPVAELVLARIAEATGQVPRATAEPVNLTSAASPGTQHVPFRVVGVVTQPPAPQRRSGAPQPSPTHRYAVDVLQVPVWTPTRLARDESFLRLWETELRPDLAITAAYGQLLPERFLRVPPLGVLNIHPSLLPLYRGAAPVQRTLLDGLEYSGVSIVRTVLELDAGPILCQERVPIDENIQGPDLLEQLFALGAELLIQRILCRRDVARASTAAEMDELLGEIRMQDSSQATYAPKLSKCEGELSFTETAYRVHNRVRAVVDWPGAWMELIVRPGSEEAPHAGQRLRIKVLRTRIARRQGGAALGIHRVSFVEDALRVTCDDGSQLDILEVQLPGKRVQTARAFWNGLRGRFLERPRDPYPPLYETPAR
jgi:methionyl-tRNA formyltransferase